MFEKPPNYDAYYLPGPMEGLAVDDGLKLGLRWLIHQPGSPLVVLSAKKVAGNNPLLAAAIKQYRIPVAAPPRMNDLGWRGGSILAPWANERALLAIDSDLRSVAAVCVIGWSEGQHRTWIDGHRARDLRAPDEVPAAAVMLDPVVELAMQEATNSINHNNALVTYAEKAYVVRTLQELVKGGYRYDTEQLVAWVTANGWYPAEIPRLREYANGVLAGKRFVLKDTWGPGRGAAKQWEREVRDR